jgi:hypothetical protein
MRGIFYDEIGWVEGGEAKRGKDNAPTGSPRCSGRSGVNADAKFAEQTQRKKEKAYAEFTPTGSG